jgi:hypothetical protein
VTTTNEIPRRARIDLFTPAEKAIFDAMIAVEALPASEHLTAAVILLGKAKDRVADFVDGVPVLHLWWNGYDHAPGATAEDARRWLAAEYQTTEDEAEGDGWQMVPDDAVMKDEDEPNAPRETAEQFARFLASKPPRPSTPTPESDDR